MIDQLILSAASQIYQSEPELVATAGTHTTQQEIQFDPFEGQSDESQDDILGEFKKMNLKPRFISRAEWGADESMRVAKSGNFQRTFENFIKIEAAKVPNIFRPSIKKWENENGETLYWPIVENKKIAKFVIHHTGEYVDEKRDPQEIVRAIYRYHTVVKGWGDIGYHYLIDKQGNIYQGRAGSPLTMGAHTMNRNIGTIGISLFGNFEHEEPTEAQIKVLTVLLADHARRFNVPINEESIWFGTNTHNVTYHREIADKGFGTACPGQNLISQIPTIRTKAYALYQVLKQKEKKRAKKARDFLRHSSANTVIRGAKDARDKTLPVQYLWEKHQKQILSRGDKKELFIQIKNRSDKTWPADSYFSVDHKPDGLVMTSFRTMNPVLPGTVGTFKSKIWVKETPNGNYEVGLTPAFLEGKVWDAKLEMLRDTYRFQVSGNKNTFFSRDISKKLLASTVNQNFQPNGKNMSVRKSVVDPGINDFLPEDSPMVKIKLKFFEEDYARVGADKTFYLFEHGDFVKTFAPEQDLIIRPVDGQNVVEVRMEDGKTQKYKNVSIVTSGVLEIKNYDRNMGSRAYNKFRHRLDFYPQAEKLLAVNTLPIESYLSGLAEEPSTEPTAKKHTIHILARSYALVYSGAKRKFQTSLYDLEDDPATSQYYLGYDWERYHLEQTKLLAETRGMVVTYDGEAVIAPYFTQSSGESSSKWSSAYPWTRAQKLPFDEGLTPRGHGVGLSGNSARVLAKQGRNYEEIIDYFFNGVEVENKY